MNKITSQIDGHQVTSIEYDEGEMARFQRWAEGGLVSTPDVKKIVRVSALVNEYKRKNPNWARNAIKQHYSNRHRAR